MKLAFALGLLSLSLMAAPPAVGEKAPDFVLKNLDGKAVKLSEKTAKGPVVLIVLRGFPGYQCPLCNRQVKEFAAKASEFEGKSVVLVYPGPGEHLNEKAAEFVMDKKLPANFDLVLDPDYTFTKQYGLLWDAPQETAYPSTFLIDSKGMVFFSKVSKTHGGRSTVPEVVAEFAK
jgi:thioredoxin-dependent peroxiredoxin